MKITIDSILTFGGLTRQEEAALIFQFARRNPDYDRRLRLGLYIRKTPQSIYPIDYDRSGRLTGSRGLICDVLAKYPAATIQDHTVLAPCPFPTFTGVLRDYQEEATAAMLGHLQGILQAATGAGKTTMALYIASQLQQKSLILCHRQNLLSQWRNECRHFLGFDPCIICGGLKQDSGAPLHIGMVQTIQRMPDEYLQQFGLLIIDETHHTPANQFLSAVNRCPARYRFGLSATPYRIDGLDFLIEAGCGPIWHKVESTDLFQAGQLARPIVHFVKTGSAPPEETDFGSIIEHLSNDPDRNRLLGDLLTNSAEQGRPTLLLCERILHAKTLGNMTGAEVLTGETRQDTRDATLEEFTSGKIRKLISTVSLMGEGSNIPCIEALILGSPFRSKAKALQIVGRACRQVPGKRSPVVFDFIDAHGLLYSQAASRRAAYREAGYEIK